MVLLVPERGQELVQEQPEALMQRSTGALRYVARWEGSALDSSDHLMKEKKNVWISDLNETATNGLLFKENEIETR